MQLQENTESKFYVYALVDPINQTPFYIGKGSGNRAYNHLRPRGDHSNDGLSNYIRSIRQLGFEPGVGFIAENLLEKDAFRIEYTCIQLAEQRGIALVNIIGVFENRSRIKRGGSKTPGSCATWPWNKGKTGLQVAWNKGKKGVQIAWNRGISHPSYIRTQVTCPHCGKIGANSVMYRWHFDKCKQVENTKES